MGAKGAARPLLSFPSSPSRTSRLTSASLGKPVEERVYFPLFLGGGGVPLHPLEKAVSHYKVLLTTVVVSDHVYLVEDAFLRHKSKGGRLLKFMTAIF